MIPTNKKFTKLVRYIHDHKSWERCYVPLKIIFPCLRVLLLADSNHVGTEIFYYYPRIKNYCIEKTISTIDYNKLFPEINSTANIWEIYDDEGY